jgi:hypothetical protein
MFTFLRDKLFVSIQLVWLSLQSTKIMHKTRKEMQVRRKILDCWRNVRTSSANLTAWKHLMLQAIIKCSEIFIQSSRKNFPILTKVGFFADTFIRIHYTKFRRKPTIERRTFTIGQTVELTK